VRNPHERLLSAYLDKGIGEGFQKIVGACCRKKFGRRQNPICSDRKGTFRDFVSLLEPLNDGESTVPGCLQTDLHWVPQSDQLDDKFWSKINFVGHMEALERDTQALWERIGYRTGKNGSEGDDKKEQQQQTEQGDGGEGGGQHHSTGSHDRMKTYYDTKDLFDRVTELYKGDYTHPLFGFSMPSTPEWLKEE